MKYPVLILLDFEAGTVARYFGRVRTLRCAPDIDARHADWREVLQTLRYRPDSIDPNHPREPFTPEAA